MYVRVSPLPSPLHRLSAPANSSPPYGGQGKRGCARPPPVRQSSAVDTDTDTTDARTGGPAVLLRRALPADAPALAEVWLRSFAAALPTVRRAHGDEAVRGWFAHLVTGCETWGAFDGKRAVGLLVLDGDELEQLYLAPDRRGQGLGDRLVTLARERRPGGLALWTFQVNTPARRFYERHGFTETERTDGSRNEEREPDVRYVWTP